MKNIGLNSEELSLICEVFTNCSIEKGVVFGSRAKGNYRKNSDIDIALFGKTDFFESERIRFELNELPLPYKFDVILYSDIKNQELKKHIDRIGITIYN